MKIIFLLLMFLGLTPLITFAQPVALPDDTRFDALYLFTGDEPTESILTPIDETANLSGSSGTTTHLQRLISQHIEKFVDATDAVYIADCILQSSARHDVDPLLVVALFEQESGYRSSALSAAGAKGVAQIMPTTAAALGVDINDTAANIDGGIMYLGDLLRHFTYAGDMQYSYAIAAYNSGRYAVDHYKDVPPYAETRNHVSSIAKKYQALIASAGS